MKNLAIYRDVPVVIEFRDYRETWREFGDVPVGSINTITNRFEPCINPRGWGYAHRNRPSYRNNRKEVK